MCAWFKQKPKTKLKIYRKKKIYCYATYACLFGKERDLCEYKIRKFMITQTNSCPYDDKIKKKKQYNEEKQQQQKI